MKFVIKQLMLLVLLSGLPCVTLFSKKSDKAEKRKNDKELYKPRCIPEVSDIPSNLNNDASTSIIHAHAIQFPEQWILDSALDNAPQLLHGVVAYLLLHSWVSRSRIVGADRSMAVPSYHRFILVGPPGSGKTTLAYAVARSIGYDTAYIPATSFLGYYRNQTGINISQALKELTANQRRIVIIIDELHKLFEHHASDHADDSQTAAAFWLVLDEIQQYNPYAIIIGTANNVGKLPPEIKSRFSGKIIAISMPDKKKRVDALEEMLSNDKNIIMEEPFDRIFFQNITDQMNDGSLRDLQSLIDTAKILYYGEYFKRYDPEYQHDDFDRRVILTKKHFQKALGQRKAEYLLTKESLFDSELFSKRLQNWSTVLYMTLNIIGLVRLCHDFLSGSYLASPKEITHHA